METIEAIIKPNIAKLVFISCFLNSAYMSFAIEISPKINPNMNGNNNIIG